MKVDLPEPERALLQRLNREGVTKCLSPRGGDCGIRDPGLTFRDGLESGIRVRPSPVLSVAQILPWSLRRRDAERVLRADRAPLLEL